MFLKISLFLNSKIKQFIEILNILIRLHNIVVLVVSSSSIIMLLFSKKRITINRLKIHTYYYYIIPVVGVIAANKTCRCATLHTYTQFI